MNKEEILNFIRVRAKARGTLVQLSKETGIPRSHLYTIFNGNPTLGSLLKLCEVLEINFKVTEPIADIAIPQVSK